MISNFTANVATKSRNFDKFVIISGVNYYNFSVHIVEQSIYGLKFTPLQYN